MTVPVNPFPENDSVEPSRLTLDANPSRNAMSSFTAASLAVRESLWHLLMSMSAMAGRFDKNTPMILRRNAVLALFQPGFTNHD